MLSRLRDIYAALDANRPKQALKLCNVLLQKHGQVHYLLALKAIALFHLDKEQEATQVADAAAMHAESGDGQLLSTLQIFYSTTNQSYKVGRMYEAAYKANPDDGEIAQGLARSYLRDQNYQALQRLALKLHKRFGDPLHLAWAIAGLIIQADCHTPASILVPAYDGMTLPQPTRPGHEVLRTQFLRLALGLLSRDSVEMPCMLQFRHMVLRRLGDYPAALDLIRTSIDREFSKLERLRAEAVILEQSGQHLGAAAAYKCIFCDDSAADDWGAIEGFIRCSLSANGVDSAAEIREHINMHFGSRVGQRGASRSAILADIELEYQLMRNGSDENEAALALKLEEYFRLCGDKPCCRQDVAKVMVSLLEPESLLQRLEGSICEGNAFISLHASEPILGRLEACIPQGCSSDNMKCLRNFGNLCNWFLTSGLATKWSWLERCNQASKWFQRMYCRFPKQIDDEMEVVPIACAQLYIGRPIVSWLHRDQFIIESSGGPFQFSKQNSSDPGLLKYFNAAIVLETALVDNPGSTKVKLALSQIHLCLGVTHTLPRLYESCSIKEVQHESLSYLVLPAAFQLGDIQGSTQLLSSVMSFRENGMKHASAMIEMAWNNCESHQMIEFAAFSRLLDQSWWRCLVDVISLVIKLFQLGTNEDELKKLLNKAAEGEGSVLSLALTAEKLAQMADTLDLRVFDDHHLHFGESSPQGSYAHQLCEGWLPRRQLLLLFIRLYICTDWKNVQTHCASNGKLLMQSREFGYLINALSKFRQACGMRELENLRELMDQANILASAASQPQTLDRDESRLKAIDNLSHMAPEDLIIDEFPSPHAGDLDSQFLSLVDTASVSLRQLGFADVDTCQVTRSSSTIDSVINNIVTISEVFSNVKQSSPREQCLVANTVHFYLPANFLLISNWKKWEPKSLLTEGQERELKKHLAQAIDAVELAGQSALPWAARWELEIGCDVIIDTENRANRDALMQGEKQFTSEILSCLKSLHQNWFPLL